MKFKELFKKDDFEDEYMEFPKWVRTLIFFAVWVVILNLLAIIYINKSEYIYFWDNATYWDISRSIANGAMLPDFFKNLYASIGSMDYNYLAGLMSAVFIKLFGESRLVYVLTLVNLYLIPSMIIVYHLAKKLGKAPEITLTIIMLICPAIAFMAFIGFVDIGGLLGALLCFYLYFEKDNAPPKWWKYIIIGAILVLLMLWRRWYAFFAVSFVTAMAADCIINKKRIFMPLITVAAAGIILFVLFKDFTFNILLRNYGDLYAGYKFSAGTDFKLITRYFGIIYLLTLLVASILIMVKKKDLRPAFCWIQMIVCAVMFIIVQTHGQQHLLLYIPSLIVLTILLVRYIDRAWMLIAIFLLSIIHSVNVCIPYAQPQNIQEIKIYSPIPTFSMLPRKRADTYDILNLKRRLDTVVGEGETLGVLASSFTINEDILRNVEPSLGIEKSREDYIVSLPQVDSRDNDFSVYDRVNYVLVAMPAQTHLAEGSQKAIEEPVKSFMEWTDIAMAYEEMYDFATNIDGIDIKLFKRVRNLHQFELVNITVRCNQ